MANIILRGGEDGILGGLISRGRTFESCLRNWLFLLLTVRARKKSKMKNLKVMLMTLLMSLITVVCLAQTEISNTPLLIINDKPSTSLNKASGWGLHENGQWVSIQNKILVLTKTVIEIDNFVSYEFRDIRINDTLYTLFIKKYKTGWWTYPTMYEGWNPTIDGVFFVIKKSDMDSLKITKDTINLIKINVIYSGVLDNLAHKRQWDDKICMDKIKTDISKQASNEKIKNAQSLVFHIAPYIDKNIVRFQIYSMSKLGSVSAIRNEYKPKDPNGKYGYEKLQIYGTNRLFDYCYYEIDYQTFEKFIPLKY